MDDDFELRKTGRFRVLREEDPADAPDEPTVKRERPAPRVDTNAKTDPAFDRRKTQIFRRRDLRPSRRDDETEEGASKADAAEAEPITGEYERGKPKRSGHPSDPDT